MEKTTGWNTTYKCTMKLGRDFYTREDVVQVSKDLLGKFLFTRVQGAKTGGVIIETEAYAGIHDKASHAYNNRRTARTEIMYREGGAAYVYLCYGIHSLFNVVTNKKDVPHAVLIRAVVPEEGISVMVKRRNKKQEDKALCSGPGSLSKSLGIHFSHSGTSLLGNEIWIEDRGIRIAPPEIISGPRIGVDYAGKDALLPYRFRVKQGSFG